VSVLGAKVPCFGSGTLLKPERSEDMKRYLTHRLQREHSRLETALAQEARRPEPDGPTLRAIKRRKLQVKDRLRALGSEPVAEGIHIEHRFSGVGRRDAAAIGSGPPLVTGACHDGS